MKKSLNYLFLILVGTLFFESGTLFVRYKNARSVKSELVFKDE